MKKIIYIFSLLVVSGMYAQEKTPVDKMEETKTTTTTVDKNGEKIVVSKVKETTRKEQEIKTKQKGGNTVDGDKIDTPIQVTKTIQIDSDWDPFYNAKDKMASYSLRGENVDFSSNSNGFLMSSSQNKTYGEARKSAQSHFYLTTIDGNPGVGYFDQNGNFVVEYYDQQNDRMVHETYVTGKI
ncbi:MAG: hypothetical protein ACSHXF_10605 [Aquaticitalea sp.]